MSAAEPFLLRRFLDAQEGVYEDVCAELRAGEKRDHWMWFIFPQIAGLGHSDLSKKYAISSLDEARAYLAHAVLGSRLRECVQLVMLVEGRSLEEIFGGIDSLKFRSSMTLFAHAAADDTPFRAALRKYCVGKFDPRTLERLGVADRPG